jgi:hypothetical protein
VRQATAIILSALLEAEEEDIDFKDVYADTSPEAYAEELTRRFFQDKGDALRDGHPWFVDLSGYRLDLRYFANRNEYRLSFHVPGDDPFGSGMSYESGWHGDATPRKLKNAAIKLLARGMPEAQRRWAVSVLYRQVEEKLRTSRGFKQFVEGLEGMEYQGHTIDYQTMTMDDVAFWHGVLKRYGH